jgi:hypothetical protein
VTVGSEIAGNCQNAGVVVTEPEARRQDIRIGVVELDVERTARVANRNGRIEPTLHDAEIVEEPQRRTGEISEFGVVALGLELRDHNDGNHNFVLVEAQHPARIGEQDAGV